MTEELLVAEALLSLKGPGPNWARSPEAKQKIATAREVSRKLRDLVAMIGAAPPSPPLSSSSSLSPPSSSPPSFST
jgi:hypothetical protein